MKKILFLLTILISSNVLGEWVPVTVTIDNIMFFVDKDTITKKGNKVKYWQKMNLYTTDNEIKSIRSFHEADCKERTSKKLDVTSFNEIDFKGKMLANFEPSPTNDYIAPETSGEIIFNYVCK